MKTGNIKTPSVGSSGGNLSTPNAGPGNGGNLAYRKVGDGTDGPAKSDGPMKDKGSYSNGSAPGTVKAK